ncbi:hypothetical protein D9Q98_003916 [Chlorella vulgaris]|uniref:Uncharacterized protein n=1 Tax=Chlorella vulgaris TaxID=3077 RepID=A0A9D4TQZ8_CHLVU|nr:hypothetical protein D9Q98_003916 [Chlorella vulgaris]
MLRGTIHLDCVELSEVLDAPTYENDQYSSKRIVLVQEQKVLTSGSGSGAVSCIGIDSPSAHKKLEMTQAEQELVNVVADQAGPSAGRISWQCVRTEMIRSGESVFLRTADVAHGKDVYMV